MTGLGMSSQHGRRVWTAPAAKTGCAQLPPLVPDAVFRTSDVLNFELREFPVIRSCKATITPCVVFDLILKAQLKLKGVSYAQLADLIGDKEPNVRNKLSRGKFSAAFFLQCLGAVGAGPISVESL